MRQFQQKQIFKERLYSKTTIFCLLALTLLLSKGVFNIYVKEKESQKNRKEAEVKLLNLKERSEELKRASERLKTPLGVEEELRSKFGVAKKGEKVILIVEDKDQEVEVEKNGFFVKILDFFKFW